MYCKKCGSRVDSNSNFCTNCGTIVNSNINDINNVNQSSIDKNTETKVNTEILNNNEPNMDEKLIKIYIGRNADKMYPKLINNKLKFNLWSILFSRIYFLYRKMYLVVLLQFLITISLFLFAPSISNMTGIISFLFYPIYKWDINRKIKKLKQENNNIAEDQLIKIVRNKGGVSVIGAIIGILIEIISVLTIIIL